LWGSLPRSPAVPKPTPSAPPPQRRLNWLAIGALAVVLIGAMIGIGIVYSNKDRNGGGGNGGGGGGSVTEAYVPTSFVRDGDAKVVRVGNRDVYERIKYVFADKTDIVFILIPKKRPDEPDTFYMMRDKVTNHAFAQF